MKRIAIMILLALLATGCRQTSPETGNDPLDMSTQSIRPDPAVPEKPADFLPRQPDERPSIGSSKRTNEPAPAADTPSKAAALQPQPPAAAKRTAKPKPAKPKAPPVSARQKKLTLPELRAKYPESFKTSGAAREKRIALTFDDGPDDSFTPQVLDVLKAHGVKATFFLIGKRAEEHPDMVRRIVREGHVIGNHSYGHPLFTKLTVEQFAGETNRAEDVLSRLCGYRPKLLRPPYGEIDEEQLQWAKSNGYVIVNWNVDSLDWKSIGEEQVSRNVLSHTKAGSIILQHSAGGNTQDLSGTVKALPGIIAKLREQGYDLVTVPSLLHLPGNR